MDVWSKKLAGARDWLVVVLTVECVVLVGIVRAQGTFQHAGMDFLTSYTAAEMLLHGDGKRLYETRAQWEYQRPLIQRFHVQWGDRVIHPYVAPPLLGALVILLVPMPALSADVAWSLLDLLAVVLALVGRQGVQDFLTLTRR